MKKDLYQLVLNTNKCVNSCLLLLVCLLATGLSACGTGNPPLNSERIERDFGSYGVEVLYSEPGRRVSSLYSTRGDKHTTRTYAVVELSGGNDDAYAREHATIESGASIGATFRDAGWLVSKRHLFIGEFEIPAAYSDIGDLMQISLPQILATHVYVLQVSKDGRSFSYATITEIHHPDYLTASDLKKIYGEIIFDDSNRDSIHEFIGAPNPRK
jgi:hypothetical protein